MKEELLPLPAAGARGGWRRPGPSPSPLRREESLMIGPLLRISQHEAGPQSATRALEIPVKLVQRAGKSRL
jgi:hypothetical protein